MRVSKTEEVIEIMNGYIDRYEAFTGRKVEVVTINTNQFETVKEELQKDGNDYYYRGRRVRPYR